MATCIRIRYSSTCSFVHMATLYLLHMQENSQYLQPYPYSAGYFACVAGGGPFEWGLLVDRQSTLRTRGKARLEGVCLLYPHPGFVPKASPVSSQTWTRKTSTW